MKHPTASPFTWSLFCLIAGSLFHSPLVAASKLIFEEPTTHLKLDLNVPNASVCILHPAELQDTAACKGVTINASERQQQQLASLSAVYTVDKQQIRLFVLVLPRVLDEPMSKQEAAGFVSGMAKNLAQKTRGSHEDSAYDLLVLNRHQVIRFFGPKDANPLVVHAVAGKAVIASIVFFSTSTKDFKRVQTLASEVVQSLDWEPASTTAAWQETESETAGEKFERGEEIGKRLGIITSLLVVCAILLGQYVRYRRKHL